MARMPGDASPRRFAGGADFPLPVFAVDISTEPVLSLPRACRRLWLWLWFVRCEGAPAAASGAVGAAGLLAAEDLVGAWYPAVAVALVVVAVAVAAAVAAVVQPPPALAVPLTLGESQPAPFVFLVALALDAAAAVAVAADAVVTGDRRPSAVGLFFAFTPFDSPDAVEEVDEAGAGTGMGAGSDFLTAREIVILSSSPLTTLPLGAAAGAVILRVFFVSFTELRPALVDRDVDSVATINGFVAGGAETDSPVTDAAITVAPVAAEGD